MISKSWKLKQLFVILTFIPTLILLVSIIDITIVQINPIKSETEIIKDQKIKTSNNKPFNNKITSISYNNQSPLTIKSDSDFLNYPFISGNGDETNPYIIDNLNITNKTLVYLISISDTSAYFRISNCLLDGGHTGIYIDNAANGMISNNTINNSLYFGIKLANTNKIIIQLNRIYNTRNGIRLVDYCKETKILNNSIRDCTITGILVFKASDVNFSNNLIQSNNYSLIAYISTNVLISNNRISYSINHGIMIVASMNITITMNNVSYNTDTGIFISSYSNKTNVLENNINNNNRHGIEVRNNSKNITISKNSIANNGFNGIVFFNNTINNLISNNTITDSGLHSIEISRFSSFNIISSNIVSSNSRDGINITTSCHNNTFSNNIIEHNEECGIYVSNLCENNSFFNNSFVINNDYGIYLDSTTRFNVFSWNDFINNKRNGQDSQGFDDGVNNTFCYNYWNEWTKPDSNNDGFVDEPYDITGSALNQDPFPLAEPNNPLPLSQSSPSDLSPLEAAFAYLLGILLFVSIIGIIVGLVYTTRKKYVPRQSVNNKKIIKYESNLIMPTSSISNLETETSSIVNKEVWKKRDFPDTLPWLIVIIAAIVGFIPQIVRPPEVRNLSNEQVVEHPLRKKIISILREKQIQHFSGLKRSLDCGTYVLLWHLQVLEDFRIIHCYTLHKIKAYYLKNSGISHSKINLFCTIQSQKGLLITSTFLKDSFKGWSIKDLYNHTKLNYYTIRYYCKKLEKIGIIQYFKDTKQFRLVVSQQQDLHWLLQLYNFKQ